MEYSIFILTMVEPKNKGEAKPPIEIHGLILVLFNELLCVFAFEHLKRE